MRWIYEFFATIGSAYYAYAVVSHVAHEANPFAVVLVAGVVVFLIAHYGRDFVLRLGRIISGLGHGLQYLGAFLLSVPDGLKDFFVPPRTDSTIDRRAWEIRFDRRMIGILFVVLAFLVGALVKTWISYPALQEAKIAPITPPPAPQPFEKKWIAPGAPEGIGGPVILDTPPAQSPSALPETPAQTLQTVVQPKKVHSQPREYRMKDPWDFPRF